MKFLLMLYADEKAGAAIPPEADGQGHGADGRLPGRHWKRPAPSCAAPRRTSSHQRGTPTTITRMS